MGTVYKLTDQNMCTYNKTKWKLGEWKETDGRLPYLCSNSWLHAYSHPLLAAMFCTHRLFYDRKLLFKAEWVGDKLEDGTKLGVTRMRLIKRIPTPRITVKQKIKFGILCALEVSEHYQFKKWAKSYLSGKESCASTQTMMKNTSYNLTHSAYTAASAVLELQQMNYKESAVTYYALTAALCAYEEMEYKGKKLDFLPLIKKAMKK